MRVSFAALIVSVVVFGCEKSNPVNYDRLNESLLASLKANLGSDAPAGITVVEKGSLKSEKVVIDSIAGPPFTTFYTYNLNIKSLTSVFVTLDGKTDVAFMLYEVLDNGSTFNLISFDDENASSALLGYVDSSFLLITLEKGTYVIVVLSSQNAAYRLETQWTVFSR